MEASPPQPPAPPQPPGYGPYAPGAYPQQPYAYGPPPKSRGFPVWAIVLIVVAVLIIPTMIMAAIAIPVVVNQRDKANDSSVKEGTHSIQVGIQSWAVDHKDVYPPPDEVSADGEVGRAMAKEGMKWPDNPFTDEPMRQGTAEGDFRYTRVDGGSDYTLAGNLADGGEFRVR